MADGERRAAGSRRALQLQTDVSSLAGPTGAYKAGDLGAASMGASRTLPTGAYKPGDAGAASMGTSRTLGRSGEQSIKASNASVGGRSLGGAGTSSDAGNESRSQLDFFEDDADDGAGLLPSSAPVPDPLPERLAARLWPGVGGEGPLPRERRPRWAARIADAHAVKDEADTRLAVEASSRRGSTLTRSADGASTERELAALAGDASALAAVAELPGAQVCIYVSGTLSDTLVERALLMQDVWPYVGGLCAVLGLAFSVVDPRWGADEEQQRSASLASACLKEVNRCRAARLGSGAVYFVGIVGDKYGPRPGPPAVAAPEFKLLRRYVTREMPEAGRSLDAWYAPDANCRDEPLYARKPRPSAVPPRTWRAEVAGPAEAALRKAATRASNDNELADDRLDVYLLSTLERELHAGVLAGLVHLTAGSRASGAVLIRRSFIPAGWHDAAHPSIGAWADTLPGGAPDIDARTCLSRLKEYRLRGVLDDDLVLPADLPWCHPTTRETGVSPDAHPAYLRSVADTVCDRVVKSILNYAPTVLAARGQPRSAIMSEVLAHWAAARAKASSFVGRKDDLAMLLDFLEPLPQLIPQTDKEVSHLGGSTSLWTKARPAVVKAPPMWPNTSGRGPTQSAPPPAPAAPPPPGALMILHGDVGVGKTTLLCRAALLAAEPPHNAGKGVLARSYVILRLVGTTPRSRGVRQMLRGVTQQLALLSGQSASGVPRDMPAILEELRTRLAHATKPTALIFDGLNSLDDTDDALSMKWVKALLPLPTGVKLIISLTQERPMKVFDHICLSAIKDLIDPPEERAKARGHTLKPGPFRFVEIGRPEPGVWIEAVESWLKAANRKLTELQRSEVVEALLSSSLALYARLVVRAALAWHSTTGAPAPVLGIAAPKGPLPGAAAAAAAAAGAAGSLTRQASIMLMGHKPLLRQPSMAAGAPVLMTIASGGAHGATAAAALASVANTPPPALRGVLATAAGHSHAPVVGIGPTIPATTSGLLGRTVEEMMDRLLESLEISHGAMLVGGALGLVSVARHGLTFPELADMLACDDALVESTFSWPAPTGPSATVAPVARRCPELQLRGLLTELVDILPARLQPSDEDGRPLYAWDHRQFRAACLRRYAGDVSGKRRLFGAVRDYFTGRWAFAPKRVKVTLRNFDGYPAIVAVPPPRVSTPPTLAGSSAVVTHGLIASPMATPAAVMTNRVASAAATPAQPLPLPLPPPAPSSLSLSPVMVPATTMLYDCCVPAMPLRTGHPLTGRVNARKLAELPYALFALQETGESSAGLELGAMLGDPAVVEAYASLDPDGDSGLVELASLWDKFTARHHGKEQPAFALALSDRAAALVNAAFNEELGLAVLKQGVAEAVSKHANAVTKSSRAEKEYARFIARYPLSHDDLKREQLEAVESAKADVSRWAATLASQSEALAHALPPSELAARKAWAVRAATSVGRFLGLLADGSVPEREFLGRLAKLQEAAIGRGPEVGLTLGTLAERCAAAGSLPEAESYAAGAVELLEPVGGAPLASALERLAAIRHRLSAPLGDVLWLCECAVALREQALVAADALPAAEGGHEARAARLALATALEALSTTVQAMASAPARPTDSAESLRAKALSHLERALEAREAALGEHPQLGPTLESLAAAHEAAGRTTEARSLLERYVDMMRRCLGPNHPKAATSMLSLAKLLEAEGFPADHRAAVALCRHSLAIQTEMLGPRAPQLVPPLKQLAAMLIVDDEAEAVLLLERAVTLLRPKRRLGIESFVAENRPNSSFLWEWDGLYKVEEGEFGIEAEDTPATRRALAALLESAGRLCAAQRSDTARIKAIDFYSQELDVQEELARGSPRASFSREENYAGQSDACSSCLRHMGAVHASLAQELEAIALYEQALEMALSLGGPLCVGAGRVYGPLGALYLARGRKSDALMQQRRLLEYREAVSGRDSARVADCLLGLAAQLRDVGAADEMAAIYARCETLYSAAGDPDAARAAALEWARAEARVGRASASEALYTRHVDELEATEGVARAEAGGRFRLSGALAELARVHARGGALPAARAAYARALAVRESALAPEPVAHWPLTELLEGLAAACLRLPDGHGQSAAIAAHERLLSVYAATGADYPYLVCYEALASMGARDPAGPHADAPDPGGASGGVPPAVSARPLTTRSLGFTALADAMRATAGFGGLGGNGPSENAVQCEKALRGRMLAHVCRLGASWAGSKTPPQVVHAIQAGQAAAARWRDDVVALAGALRMTGDPVEDIIAVLQGKGLLLDLEPTVPGRPPHKGGGWPYEGILRPPGVTAFQITRRVMARVLPSHDVDIDGSVASPLASDMPALTNVQLRAIFDGVLDEQAKLLALREERLLQQRWQGANRMRAAKEKASALELEAITETNRLENEPTGESRGNSRHGRSKGKTTLPSVLRASFRG